MEVLAGLIGILAPAVAALFKRLKLSKVKQDMVILVFLVVVAGVIMVGSGEISLLACSKLGLEECVGVVYKYVGLVLGSALVSYKLFWSASGLDDRIAGK